MATACPSCSLSASRKRSVSSERGGLEKVYRRLLLRCGGGLDGKSVTSGGEGGGLSRLM